MAELVIGGEEARCSICGAMIKSSDDVNGEGIIICKACFKEQKQRKNSDALGFENQLWEAADKLRSNMDAAVYKHVVLGLIFLKYISDSFDELYEALKADHEADEEDEDEYIAQKVFWVPKAARWTKLKDNARQPEIGQIIDDAMRAIEKRNLALKGVLPKDYARQDLDKVKLGELVDLIGGIGLGDKENRSKDILGRVYEYFLGQFASAEGKKGGQFYTPRSIVKLLVEMIRPFKGRIYDPCCGSGGMFVQSDLFIKEHGGKIQDLAIYGQESNPTTWRLFKMNLALRRISANIGPNPADTFGKDLHPDLRADYIIANPPFNIKDWGQPNLLDDPRWIYGIPSKKNANYAWVQHIIHHLSTNGMAGFVLANGSLSSKTNGEGDIRQAIIEADLLDCVVALPGQLFFNTQIPACLWLLSKNKADRRFRDRRGETLFIDCRRMGEMISRTQREMSDELLEQISGTYLAWKDDKSSNQEYEDEMGFCRSSNLDDIKDNGYIISPGRYVGLPLIEDNGEPFEEIMKRITLDLGNQFSEAGRLEEKIRKNMEEFGFEI
jgi:type I restriction enzyme M protein